MQWSRAALIEYLALAASIGFALAGMRWRTARSGRWYALSLALGCVAALVKITTALFWVAPFGLLGLPRDDQTQTARSRLAAWSLAVGPILVGILWTRYADAIKVASEATAWLTSSALLSWNVGDLPQRLDRASWERALAGVVLLAWGIALPLLACPTVMFAMRRQQIRFVSWIVMTLAGPVLVFFNLYYQQDYYAMATSASIAILVAIGFVGLAEMRVRVAQVLLIVSATLMTVFWVVYIPYWTRIYEPISDSEGVLPLAAQIERETDPGQLVAIIGRDWQPSILYYAHRWGWMLRGQEIDPAMQEQLLADGYAIYRCPWLRDSDYCLRLDATSLAVPVPAATIGPVTGRTGLIQSAI